MKYLQIKSKEEIDINAFTLLGASTKKDDDTKIGWFGSGLKYAIASLIRNKIEFQVFSGLKEIKFRLKNVKFRDQKFNMITVNSRQTSLTDTMGGTDWDNSFAPIREIYSNALDEDENAIIQTIEYVEPKKDYTTIYIKADTAILNLYDNLSDYFITKNPNVAFSNSYASVYKSKGEKHKLYRKGILCYEGKNKEKAIFNYNSNHFSINESRVINDTYSMLWTLADCWGACENIESIAIFVDVLREGANYFERKLDFSYTRFSDTWKKFIADKKFYAIEHDKIFQTYQKEERIRLPLNMLSKLKNQFNSNIDVLGLDEESNIEGVNYISDPPNVLINKILDAIAILKNTTYKSRLKEPKIRIAIFAHEETLATIKNNNIVLAQKLDTYSVSEIAKIIIEENEHMLSGFIDYTLEFQDHMFNLYFEEITKRPFIKREDINKIFVDVNDDLPNQEI